MSTPTLLPPGFGQHHVPPPLRPRRTGRRVVVALVLAGFAMLGAGTIVAGMIGDASDTGYGAGGCVAALAPPAGQPGVGQWDEQQRSNAAAIVAAGQAVGAPARAQWIALATAMQESTLNNLPGGDRDSAGLFQQRPSQGWGDHGQVTDPDYASRQFYARLLAIPGWDSMPLAEAAQVVQRSAFPDAYTKWEQPAADLLGQLGGGANLACTGANVAASDGAATAINWAGGQLGKPYQWGATGPDRFDCSGLTMRAWQAAGVQLPRVSRDQASAGQQIPRAQAQPGDLLFWSSNGAVSGVHHVALYLGNGQIREAPTTGIPVRDRALGGAYDEREMLPFAIRPGAPA
ncbi:C40 family peptidase [Pseudonocardia sp. RS010]|uniref:C40 family peptidase n=1 Tax=Pseudonocardia sp. RS010 TaxID=3385979 RepID=UPI0039A33DE0